MKQKDDRCRYCGGYLPPDDAVCPSCGERNQRPSCFQPEYWGLIAGLAVSVIAFVTAFINM